MNKFPALHRLEGDSLCSTWRTHRVARLPHPHAIQGTQKGTNGDKVKE